MENYVDKVKRQDKVEFDSHPLVFEDEHFMLSGEWNPPYTGKMEGTTLQYPVPQDYEQFLRKHDGGVFCRFCKKQYGWFDYYRKLVFMDAKSVFNNNKESELRTSGALRTWTDSYFDDVYEGRTGAGLLPDESRAVFDYFFDTHLVIAIETYCCDAACIAIDKNGEYVYVNQVDGSNIEDTIEQVQFEKPVEGYGQHAFYTQDGFLFVNKDNNKVCSYKLKPYSEMPPLAETQKKKAEHWLHDEDQIRSISLLGLFEKIRQFEDSSYRYFENALH